MAGRQFGPSFSSQSPEMSWDLYKVWLMPAVCPSTVKLESFDSGATITGMVKRNVLKEGPMYAHVYCPNDESDDHLFKCEWTAPKSEDDSTTFSCTFSGLQPNRYYSVDLCMGTYGTPVTMYGSPYGLGFRTYNTAVGKKAAALVRKVSTAMGFDNIADCPWSEADETNVIGMTGVSVELTNDGSDIMWISLVPDASWPYKSDIRITSDISESLTYKESFWTFYYTNEESAKAVKSLYIDDPKYCETALYWDPTQCMLERYEIHVSRHEGSYISISGYTHLKYVDISGSGFTSLSIGSFTSDEGCPYELEEVVATNCKNLKEIYVEWYIPRKVPSINVSGSPINKISLYYCKVSGDVPIGPLTSPLESFYAENIQGSITVPDCQECVIRDFALGDGEFESLDVTIKSQALQKLEMMPVKSVTMSDCPVFSAKLKLEAQESIKLLTLPSLSTAELYANDVEISQCAGDIDIYPGEKVSVTASPAMSSLFIKGDFTYGGVTLSGLSALESFAIWGEKLTGIVFPVIDEVRGRGGYVGYTQRYSYKWDEEAGKMVVESDLGYGLYYSGEPERGYHLDSEKWWE